MCRAFELLLNDKNELPDMLNVQGHYGCLFYESVSNVLHLRSIEQCLDQHLCISPPLMYMPNVEVEGVGEKSAH